MIKTATQPQGILPSDKAEAAERPPLFVFVVLFEATVVFVAFEAMFEP